jgi:hypothetical protein
MLIANTYYVKTIRVNSIIPISCLLNIKLLQLRLRYWFSILTKTKYVQLVQQLYSLLETLNSLL